MSETLTIVLRADGSGLTGTVKASADAVRQFGLQADQAGQKVEGAGTRSRKAAKDIDDVGRSAKGCDGSLRGLVGRLNSLNGILATLGLSLLAREMIGAGLAMDRLERSTAAAVGSQTLAARELGFVREQAERLGIYFPVLAQGFAGLAASTRGTVLAGAQTREIFLGVAEAGRAMNLTNEQIQGTLTALQQIAGKGTVSMEELRQQLGDRLPGAMQIAARSMKMGVGEFVKLVSEGKVLASDFLPKFAKEMRAAAAAGVLLAQNSPAAEFGRLKTALFDLGVATARGGVLDALATAAKAMTAALNSLVSSGAIQTITSLLLKVALAGSVMFVGGLLQRGLLALRVAIGTALISTQGLAVASGGASVALTRQAVATVATATATRGLAAALAFVQANPIMLAVTAVTLLATWLYTSRTAAEEAATALREGFKGAKLALDDFNRTPSLAASFILADAKIGETMDNIRARLVELREEQQALSDQSSRSLARFGYADPKLAEGMRVNGEEMQRLAGQLNGLEVGGAAASEYFTTMTLRMAGLSAVTPEVRRELMGVSQQVANGTKDLIDAVPMWQKIIARYYDAATAARVTADGISEIITASSGATEIVDGLAKNLAKLNIQMAGLQGGSAAEITRRVGYEIVAKGGPDKMTPAELAAIGRGMQSEIALTQQVEEAQAALVESRKAATAATRDQAKATREGIRDDNAAAQATRALNDLIRDQQNEYAGPVKKAANDYAAALERIQLAEDNLVKAHRLDAEQLAKLAVARTEAAKANDRNVALAQREEQALLRKQDLVAQAVNDYNDETRAVAASAREHAVQEAVLRAEDAAREQYRRGQRQSIDLTLEETAALRAGIEASYGQREVAEQAAQAANEYRNSWRNAIGSVSDAFGDWMTGGIGKFKDFGKALKDIARRFLSDLIAQFSRNSLVPAVSKWMRQYGSAAAQTDGGGGWMQALFGGGQGGTQGSGFWNAVKNVFTSNSGAQQASGYATAGSGMGAVGSIGNFGNNLGGFTGAGASTGSGYGGMGMGSGSLLQSAAPAMPLAGAAYGAYYGFTERGSGGASSLAAGISYGALGYAAGTIAAGAIGGAAAAGAATAGAGLYVGASAAAGGAAAGGMTAAMAIPIVGWVIAALAIIDLASGGKVFGSKFKTTSASTDINFGPEGASGTFNQYQERQKALFGGKKYRTITAGVSEEAQAEIDKVFFSIRDAVVGAATEIGIDVPDMVAASFRQGFDRKGNLVEEFGTIAGKVYKEAQEVFLKRLVAENILQVAKAVGSAAEIEALAEQYRSTPDVLTDFASLMLAVQADIHNARNLWSASGQGVLTDVVGLVERLGRGSESLVETYARLTTGAKAYGDLIAGVDTQLMTSDLNQYQRAQLDIELGYRGQVKQANDLAKALGLTGARSEDLAKIEQLRALNMAKLQTQMEAQKNTFLDDLGLSDLSPLRDDQKLVESMQLLRDAVGAGDLQRAQQLSQTALGLGRNLYASGNDYSGLYGEVTGLLEGMTPAGMEGFTGTDLKDLADILTGLPKDFATALFDLLFAPAAAPITALPPPPIAPPPPNGLTPGRPGRPALGPGDGTNVMLQAIIDRLDSVAANTGGSLAQSKNASLVALNAR